ncbi:uncharacterized protein At4g15970-like isoform X1 [Ananas comosus]|uniref:Uncharacterized protein At4g15970-like isoform X1 n=1 Tax=Ananas comosus TaxID=4615 RepID=A0A6P5EWM9_ANACO|nr:uncharacterized protein At4g15970-like isoform X1 [Ananas comosus]
MTMKINNANTVETLVAFIVGATLAGALVLAFSSANFDKVSLMEVLSRSNGTRMSSSELVSEAKIRNSTVGEVRAAPTAEEKFENLRPLLNRAATDDRTVMLTFVNAATAAEDSLLDLFLESFRVGVNTECLLNHLIIVALDQKAFDRCQTIHPHCYFLEVEGENFTSEKFFGSKGFLKLVWIKIKFQQHIIELGYNCLSTDVDILWFRNPFRHITVYADLTVSSDMFFGDPDNLWNFPNTGLLYMKSTKKNAEALEYWYEARERFPSINEQNVFNKIKREFIYKFQLKIQYISTDFCGGFCNRGKDMNKICTMHANCCVGLRNKIHDLRNILADWKNFTSLPDEIKKTGQFTWRVPGRCIH